MNTVMTVEEADCVCLCGADAQSEEKRSFIGIKERLATHPRGASTGGNTLEEILAPKIQCAAKGDKCDSKGKNIML